MKTEKIDIEEFFSDIRESNHHQINSENIELLKKKKKEKKVLNNLIIFLSLILFCGLSSGVYISYSQLQEKNQKEIEVEKTNYAKYQDSIDNVRIKLEKEKMNMEIELRKTQEELIRQKIILLEMKRADRLIKELSE